MLLEKAFAKISGSFAKTDGGTGQEAFIVLTGAPTASYYIEEWDKGDFSNMISDYAKQGYSMTCGTKSTEVSEEKQPNGLVSGHEYTLLDVVTVQNKDGQREWLYKVWNPWGESEFNGRWSPLSWEWTPNLWSSLGATEQNTGVFFISEGEFFESYGNVDVCFAKKG